MRFMKAVAVLLGLAFLMTGCAMLEDSPKKEGEGKEGDSASADPAPDGDSSTKGTSKVDPSVPPRRFDAEAATTFDEESVYDGVVTDDRVLTMTLDQIRARSLPDLSSAWELSAEGIFVDVAVFDDALYAVDYAMVERSGTSVGKMELTVSRLSSSTGAVLDQAQWKSGRDVQSPGEPAVSIVGAVDDVVLVETWGSEPGGRHTLTALDLASGEELWTQRPGTLVALGDGKAVFSTVTESDPGELVGLHLNSGEQEWTALPGLTNVRQVGVYDGRLTVVTERRDSKEAALATVDLSNGSTESGATVEEAEWSCQPAVTGRAVCSLPDQHALGFNLTSNKVTWDLPTDDRYGIWITSVNQGIVYGFTANGGEVVLDAASGRDLVDDPGVAPTMANGYGGLLLYSGKALFYPSIRD